MQGHCYKIFLLKYGTEMIISCSSPATRDTQRNKNRVVLVHRRLGGHMSGGGSLRCLSIVSASPPPIFLLRILSDYLMHPRDLLTHFLYFRLNFPLVTRIYESFLNIPHVL